MLAITILVPLMGALVLLPLKDNTAKLAEQVKLVSLSISLVTCGLCFYLWLQYDPCTPGFQLVYYAPVGFGTAQLGLDGLSVYYVLLTGLLTPICLLASWSNVSHSVRLFNVFQLLTCGLLLAVFSLLDLLMFYVSFEAVLIPLFFTVGIWGGSPTRVRSAMLLFLYTLGGSLFMLLAIVGLYASTGTTDLAILHTISLDPGVQRVLWVCFAIALAIKTPLVPVHVWLPRAHADAPLAGSMVLAGTVLKLATYGVLRVMLPILPDACNYYGPLVQTVAVVSLVYSSLATLRQSDFKALVAYSSVSHMAVVVLGLFSNSMVGITGAVFLSLAHGLVSPALFMLVGGVLYDRYHSRSIRYYRGLASVMPLFSLIFFLMTCANMGVPLSMNWIGEFLCLSGVLGQSVVAGVLGSTGIVLSACYSIWLFGRLIAGSYGPHLAYTVDLTRRELAVLLPLVLLTLLLGIVPGILMDGIEAAVTSVLYTTP